MRRFVKLFLLWVLLLALPVQGFAAVMQACTMAAQAAPVHTVEAIPMALHDMSHMTMTSHQHAVADHAFATDAVAAPDLHASNDASHAAGHHAGKCQGNCAACCIGAALPQTIAFVAVSHAVTHVTPFSSLPATGHIPAFPERPPQSIFS